MSPSRSGYKFQLKQIVRLVRNPFPTKNGILHEEFEIVRLMPADAQGEVSYRIRSGNAELAVREHEITL